jgi:small subunit ribosomal protein S1
LKKSQPFSSYEVRARLPKAVLDAFKIGQKLSGVVSWIGNTLVSVDLGGAVGFVKMGDMACEPVSRPSDIVKLGDRVQVVVLGPWDAESGHLSLALIQATTQPESSSTVLDAFKIGQKCSGVVSWIGNSVVSVDLGGAVGFVKIDDMAWESVSRPSDIVKLGDRVQVVVLGPWDAESDQLSLGLKQATIQPEP